MPGTTRYSATFDRTYEEEDRVDPPPPANTRRSRSLSWQANSGLDGRPYTPLGGRPPTQRSSSTDNGSAKGPEHIPTRTAKTTVKAHNNPFQFVKVGTCPLYKKAEEQLKKAKEVKKPDVLKEEEEEWQSNLDSWKSRRRKMSEDVFRRQEEIKLLELEEQVAQANQKKTKTFSEMVESRATRGRALSLCLISSPLEFQDWEYENKTHKNGSCSFTDESEGNSTVNSEDEGVSIRGRLGKLSQSDSGSIHRTNGDAHIEQNGSKLKTTNGDFKKFSDLTTNSVQIKPKENSYIDSGLESISSSHRAGDTPDSGSDFSPDSNSSIDCDSPRTGVNILEEFTSKTSQMSQGHEITVKLTVKEKGQDFGFTFLGGKDEGQVLIASLLEGSKAETSGIHLGDRIISINGNDVSCKKHIEIVAMVQKGRETGEISLLLWRNAASGSTNGFKTEEKHTVQPNKSETQNAKSHEKSVESENEMYVDDFEELQKQSEILAASNRCNKISTNAQAQTNGNKSPTITKEGISLKITTEVSPAPIVKETKSNGAVEEPNKNEQKANSEANSENQKKNIVKVKRVRRKGVYALNVSSDSNQIPQEGISTNSLFPLSPVTELPSPAEESKTISSTLSINNVPASSSQKEAVAKEIPKKAEVKLSSTPVKEASVANAAPQTVKPVRPNELKIGLSGNSENKSESVPSPTKTKDKNISLDIVACEKPKSTTKKVKVKVKKVTASESASINSPNIKDGPPSPVTPIAVSATKESPPSPPVTSASTVKEVTTNLIVPVTVSKPSSKENSKSSSQSVDKTEKVSNALEKLISPAKEKSDTSTGTKAITPTTEALPLENKIAGITSNNIGNQSPKIVAKNEAPKSSLSTTQCSEQQKNTIAITECDKSKPVLVKKVKTKAKANSVSEEPASAVNDSNSAIMEDKMLVSASKDKVRDLTLNVNIRPDSTSIPPISPVTNTKSPKSSPKTPQGEKLKPSFSVKKEKAKSKGNAKEQVSSGFPEVATESSIPASNAKNTSKENQLQKEPKLNALDQEKGIKELDKIGNLLITPIRVDNTESAGMVAVSHNTDLTSSEFKALTMSALSDKTKNETKDLTLKIESKTESSSFPDGTENSKAQMKTPQSEKSNAIFAKKKDIVKPKENTLEQVPSIVSQVAEESFVTPVSKDVSTTNLTNGNQSPKESKSTILSQGKKIKILTKTQNVQPTLENEVQSAESAAMLSETKSKMVKDKAANVSSSSNKARNLKLKIDANPESTIVSAISEANITTITPAKLPYVEKSESAQKEDSTKSKGSVTEQVLQIPSVLDQNTPATSAIKTVNLSVVNKTKEKESPKEPKSANLSQAKKKVVPKTENAQSSSTMENVQSSGSTVILPDAKSTSSNSKSADVDPSSSETKNLKLKIDVNNTESTNISSASEIGCNKPPQTPPKSPHREKAKSVLAEKKTTSKQKGKTPEQVPQVAVVQPATPAPKTLDLSIKNCENDIQLQKESKSAILTQDKKVKTLTKTENMQPTQTRENDVQSASITAVLPDTMSASTKDDKTASIPPLSAKTRNLALKIDANAQSTNVSSAVTNSKSPKTPPKSPLTEKSKSVLLQKKDLAKSKNTNSQKVNIPAKQTEELKNPNIDSLNIVFQSQPKNPCLENQSNVIKNSESSTIVAVSTDLVSDVPPVEKVAEEMEKLILEQLEEEERAKELSLGLQMKGSPDHLLTAPPKLAEPPKEKPPPPPSANEGNQKEIPLKRVNSTKRIKKEIHKRRSNFLGIDNADESIGNSEPAIPPPPALEEILKAEMELDRQSRIKIENASTERLSLEEKEIMQKEREIIESLESEERQRQLINGTDDMKTFPTDNSSDAVIEHDRIESLIFERKRIETERLLTEEQQQIHLLEEKQLREREEFVRKQEANKQAVPLSDHSLSVAAISSLTPDTQTNVSLSGANGDGKRLTNSSTENSVIKSSESAEKKAPAVPPKPLKKKEAIRKERERLRQEQEALQREREEHRRKLLEQEELAKQQKSHAPEAPASRLGPLPPLVQPNFPPQLTSTTPNARESASFPSRSHHGAPNMASGSINAVELMGPPIVRQGMPAPRKAVQKEAWGQQKQMPSVRKQNHDSLTESRYNKNHWLIQEAEMRRITELKERQRAVQLPCSQTHLAEDEVCSNPPRVPVISPPHNPHLNYAVQDKMWNYGQSNMPPKKYPPPVVKESLHTIYPREAVSQQPPSKPSRVVPMERQEQMLSVSGRKRCSHCNEELGRGAAMIIESLQLYYHIHCFQCCVCQAQLGNGSCGTDVRVRNNKLHCHNCYSNDEAGLKFSQV